jgi:TRAP-type transport system periplasmic protein
MPELPMRRLGSDQRPPIAGSFTAGNFNDKVPVALLSLPGKRSPNRRFVRKSFIASVGALGTLGSIPSLCRAADAYTMRMNISDPANSVAGQIAIQFARAVNRRSNGQITIEVYPDNQLAKNSELLQGLVSGVLDFVKTSSPGVVPLVPQYQVFDLPFVFRDADAGFRILDGSIGDQLSADLASKGVLALGWSQGGFGELFTTSKIVATPEDVKGLRIRVQNSAVFVAMYKVLGAIPVTIDIDEAFLALTQHTVDGIKTTIDVVTSQKWYTTLRHLSILNDSFTPQALFASRRKIEALPPALQKIVKEEAKGVVPSWRAAMIRQTTGQIQTLKSSGVTVTEVQYASFRKLMDPVYASVQAKLGGDLIERINRTLSARVT